MEPFTGPAILSGKAAGVFFHEIFGHRIEGHRQKDEREGQTFTKKVNQPILPEFISVMDDPTRKHFKDEDLMGYYLYDDEGVEAEPVEVVKNGILKNFLMSRSPIEGFDRSNGHGRAQPGRLPVSRQGNLIIHSTKSIPRSQLRRMLIEACKTQDKPYGLLFEDISGGFTYTGRYFPQSFNVTPIVVYKVYVDGRPDELIRGVDLIGTPLTSFSKILACGDRLEVFNGLCGAESGAVPVSVVAPAILTGQIEVQKKEKAADRPPVLPPPKREKPLAAAAEQDRDILLEALQDELDRSVQQLHIEDMEKPYYIQYSLHDRQGFNIEASFGALSQTDQNHSRLLKVDVRVGDYELDNSGFIGTNSLFSASGRSPERVALEDDYHSIRRDIWLVTDAAFKQSLQQMAQKKAFRQNQAQVEEIPDFSRQKPVKLILPVRRIDFNQKKWQDVVRRLSLIFRQFPAIQDSAVNLECNVTNRYFINSEGTVCRYPQVQTSLLIRAETQSDDGRKLKHHLPYYAVSPEEIPPEEEIAAAVHRMAQTLSGLASAPREEDFIGPALFTGQASAQLFAQLLAPNLSGERPPLAEVPQMADLTASSKLAHRLNRRVLPSFMSVIDDPGRREYAGQSLIGAYPVDDEGVVPQPLTLVDRGILRTLLLSRRPRKDISQSNGHGRESLWGSAGAMYGNLFIKVEKPQSYRNLKRELIRMCKDQKLPYGLLIKTLDNPAITGTDDSIASLYMRSSGSSEDELTSPVAMVRVYAADGREELVRGIDVHDLDVKALKYITAAGNDYFVYQSMAAPGSGMMRRLFSVYARRMRGFGIPTTVIAPSVLFEEVEFTKITAPPKKPPLLQHPYFSR
jgi:predicted Zn-dependent protease